jgi:hypothetical protein
MFRVLLVGLVALVILRGIAAAHPPDLAPNDVADTYIAALIDESTGLSAPLRVERAFLLTLRAADEALRRGEVSNARTLLRTFAFDVRSVKRARRLRADVADSLVALAEEALVVLRSNEPTR